LSQPVRLYGSHSGRSRRLDAGQLHRRWSAWRQFSISYDEPVDGGSWNKSAKFKTIYSIIGGCPAVFTDETRNLAPAAMDPNKRQDGKHCGNDTGIDCIRQFMVPIPRL
jgi:hypothetical protein